jgi:hypothetical protein
MKGVLPFCFIRLVVPIQEICSALVALFVPEEKYFFPHPTLQYFNFLSLSPSELVRQSCWVACLLICVSGYSQVYEALFGSTPPARPPCIKRLETIGKPIADLRYLVRRCLFGFCAQTRPQIPELHPLVL